MDFASSALNGQGWGTFMNFTSFEKKNKSTFTRNCLCLLRISNNQSPNTYFFSFLIIHAICYGLYFHSSYSVNSNKMTVEKNVIFRQLLIHQMQHVEYTKEDNQAISLFIYLYFLSIYFHFTFFLLTNKFVSYAIFSWDFDDEYIKCLKLRQTSQTSQ